MSLELIQKDLENLRSAVPELKGALLASNDGEAIAHCINEEDSAARIAALAAAVCGVGRRMSGALHTGTLHELSLSAAEGQIFLYNTGGKGVLAVLGPIGANTGLIHLEARWAAREIADRLPG